MEKEEDMKKVMVKRLKKWKVKKRSARKEKQ
jgi:hypothetical protein